MTRRKTRHFGMACLGVVVTMMALGAKCAIAQTANAQDANAQNANAQNAPASPFNHSVKPNLASKKLIEYGWDSPGPQYLHDNIREMEKQPFDGVMFRLADDGGQVFKPEAWDETKLTPQLKVLADIKWGKFTDNFLTIFAASTMDWFSDSDWDKVLAHTKFAARAAKLGNCKGVLFDPEPYGDNPWTFDTQKHAKTKSFEEYAVQVRKRGKQFMQAMASEMPTLKLLMFYQYSMFYYVSHDADPMKRAQGVNGYPYALMAPFLDGMLEVAGPSVEFIDGNEFSYYYKSPLEFFHAYQTMRQSAKLYVAPDLRDKFDGQVRAANALYVDYVFNLRPDMFKNNVAIDLTPEERAKWFEHNTYYALQASDEYVWLYSEKMNWWKNENLPPGLGQAVISAKSKIAQDEPLGFDLDDTLRAVQAKVDAAIQAKLIRRNARIPKLTAAQKPTIDGKLNEAMYAKLPPLDAFVGYVNRNGDPIELKGATHAWATYDDENLYIAFRNSEPLMAGLKEAGVTRDGPVWGGDSVEISIQPNTQNSAFYHFILGPSNIQWDAIDKDKASDVTFNPNWKSAIGRGADEWVVEAAIPWRELKMKAPQAGSKLHVNLARQRLAGDSVETSSWSQFVGGFQEVQNFGTWTFG